MRVQLTKRFQRDVASLSGERQGQVFAVMVKLPGALKNPHLHSGLGLRKLHRSGIYEARIGLGLRIVFAVEPKTIILHRVGTHNEIQRYLKSL